MAEQTAALKAAGRSPHQLLDELFVKHGCHLERQINVMLPGASGMGRMKEIMAAVRATPPKSFGGLDVVRTRDQASLQTWTPGGSPTMYAGVKSDVVLFDLAGPGNGVLLPDGRFSPLGNAVAARPSGTEPKIKFYLFAVAPPAPAAELAATKARLVAQLDAVEKDLRSLVGV
jgi:phosphoglucomutase/phosphomannomutase